MTKLYHSLIGTIVSAGIFAFSGCGGGDSNTINTAYLVDSGVAGVNYQCGSQSGITGVDGVFRYEAGKDCTFSIGATSFTVASSKLAADKKITPFDVFDGDDEKTVNLARLLQTLDSDGDPDTDGIDINATAHSIITANIRFDSNFDSDLNVLVSGTDYSTIVTPVAAITHLAPNVPAPTAYTTFERIAEIDASAIATASGSSNPTDQARYVAQKIAKYFYQNNDTNVNSSADWVLGGAPSSLSALDLTNTIALANPYILEIPSPDNNKTMIVEVCNKAHAGKAINNSEVHGPALPCEIAVYTDTATGKIYVDILDPVGSFAVFFNDLTPVLTAEQQAEFAAMALQVKTEIKLITYKGLEAGSIDHVKKSTPMGAAFTPTEIAALSGQYITYTYEIDTTAAGWSTTSVRANAQKAAQEMIKAMTINIPASYTASTYEALLESNSVTYEGVTIPPYVLATSTGINGNADINTSLVGDYAISSNGYWRSARYAPLKVPRAVDTSTYGFMYTVEACSPTYAKIALSLGEKGDSRDHATALPCQMTFYIDDSNPLAPKLKVVFLNPEFMFNTLFKDKMADTQYYELYTQTYLSGIATTVKNDLVNMTRYVMDHNIDWVVPNPTITAD